MYNIHGGIQLRYLQGLDHEHEISKVLNLQVGKFYTTQYLEHKVKSVFPGAAVSSFKHSMCFSLPDQEHNFFLVALLPTATKEDFRISHFCDPEHLQIRDWKYKVSRILMKPKENPRWSTGLHYR